MQILIFGDSITYGAWDPDGGWVARLRKFLNKKTLVNPENFYATVYNLGVSGDTTEDLLERFVFETQRRLSMKREMVIVFDVGINDSSVRSRGIAKTLPKKFHNNLQKLVMLAQKFSSKIIFLGITPVDEKKTNPVSWNENAFYKNENIEQHGKIIKSICEDNSIYFIDIFDKIKKLKYKKLLEDGVHPNSRGHKKIFDIVKDFLLTNKII